MNKPFFRSSILILLFLICANCAALAVTLEGTAFDPSGQAVPGARVSLLRSLVAITECQTDARGKYKFEGLQNGVYQLAASSRGLSSKPVELDLRQAESKKQDIKLEISALSNEVVVSASLGGALVPQIGSSVSFITQEEIEDRGAQNAFEVVRGVPGVEVSQAGRRGGVAGVYIRGGESKYNAVMIDGISLNEFGGGFDLSSLPADGIERMEVTRGPQSALYGSNAVAGVINLISRRGEGPPTFTALAEGGSYSIRRFATGGSGLYRGLSWSYNLSRLDSDGAVKNDRYRNQSAFLSLGYSRSRRQLDFHFFGNANSSGAPGPYGSDPNNFVDDANKINMESRGKQNLFGYQFGYTEQLSSRIRQVTTVNVATNDLFFHLHDAMWGDSDYTSENFRTVVNTRSEILLSTTNTLAAGFEYNHETIKQTYITDDQGSQFPIPRNSFAYFVEDRWNPFSRVFLTAGIRVDNLRTHSLPRDAWGSRPAIPASSTTKVNPRISYAYIVQNDASDGIWGGTRIHGSFGTGIRPPDGFELANTDNPRVKPEKSISFDTGVEQKFFSSRTVLDITYYFNRFEDQIVSTGGSSVSRYRSDNLKNSRAQGIETSVRLRPIQSLELGGAYTFLDSSVLALDRSNTATAPFKVGESLLRRPRHSASYNVTWRHGRLLLNTNAYMRGKIRDVDPTNGIAACSWYGMKECVFESKGYTRMDAGLSFRVARGVELYGRVNNLLNGAYEEILGYPANRRNYVGGMKFTISTE